MIIHNLYCLHLAHHPSHTWKKATSIDTDCD